jgi:hypothetical protein
VPDGSISFIDNISDLLFCMQVVLAAIFDCYPPIVTDMVRSSTYYQLMICSTTFDLIFCIQVVLAAIFDLLFSQCDRHGQNLYFLPNGSISLIDNDQAYGSSWRPCGVDSLFLPGTQKHEVARLGYK